MQTGNNLIQKVIGYILLSPALLSVLLFFAQLFSKGKILKKLLESIWTGYWDSDGQGGGGGYTSALPFYFGLMAIAGAYLIKDTKK